MRELIRQCLASLALIFLSSSALAHHDEDPKAGTPIEWTATIEFVSWDGAHAMYRISVENARHEPERWHVLGASPTILAAQKIGKETLNPGDIVTVNGYLNIYNKIISPMHFTTPDGRKYAIGFIAGAEQSVQPKRREDAAPR